MTPTQLALHQAHKSRQSRFAIAAQRCVQKQPMPMPMPMPQLIKPIEPQPARRFYEVQSRLPDYVPIATRIIKLVAHEFDMSPEDLAGRKRTSRYCLARFVAVGILTEMTRMSLPAMGRRLGGRDHTTIIHAQRQAKKLFASESFRNRVDQIKAVLA